MPPVPTLRAAAAALALALGPALPAAADPVTVFAAASLKTALDEIAAGWTAETDTEVRIAYAGSSQLARQIVAGAPAGVFVSASTDWMDAVEAEGLLVPDSRRDLLGNTLVLIAHDPAAPAVTIGPGLDLPAMLGEGRLAMALVDAVPAGQYGKAALTALGLWDAVAPRVAQADNVRAALALVAVGEAPYGIVYATDAAAEPAVHVIATFPAETHPAIVYPAALVAGADAAAGAFLDALEGAAASAAFARQGFAVLD
jgi:molybdate transport system substrate-binding protein